jgi:Condensation domain
MMLSNLNRLRPLGSGERFFYLYSLVFPVHFCLVAQIEGPIDPVKIRAAFEQVRRRHSVLRICVADDAEMGPAFYGTDNPIEVHAIPIEAGADWRRIVESELSRPFDAAPGPLMRATALWAPDGASIVLTFHHTIVDALSGVRILEDLMRALAGEHLDALPLFPPIEDMIARSASAASTPEGISRTGTPSKAGKGIAQASEKLTTNISTLEWDADETARLIQCCKVNGATVHGAICAAASHHVPVSEDNTIRMHSPIDLSRVAGADSEACGVFIGAGIIEIAGTQRKPLWRDARDIVEHLRTGRSPDAVAGTMQWIASEFPPNVDRNKVKDFFASQPQSSIVVSNLGVLPLAANYGAMALKAVWGPALLTNLPADRQTIGVSTFAGRLSMVHQSYQPIPGLLEAIRETLRASCV